VSINVRVIYFGDIKNAFWSFLKIRSHEPYSSRHHNVFVIETEGTRDKWVPVTKAWRVLRLRMEERPPVWRVAANILNKQSRIADKGWSSNLGVGRCADYSSTSKCILLRNVHTVQDKDKWRALANKVMKIWVPYNAWYYLTSWKSISFSRRILLHKLSK
jgi:hypothetical protein